jgi:hypothetical protein
MNEISTSPKDGRKNVGIPFLKIGRSIGTSQKNQVAQDVSLRTPPYLLGDFGAVANKHAHGGH